MNMIKWFIPKVFNSYAIICIYIILTYLYRRSKYLNIWKKEATQQFFSLITGIILHLYMLNICNCDYNQLFDQYKQDPILFIFNHIAIGLLYVIISFGLMSVVEDVLKKNYLFIFKWEKNDTKRSKYGYKNYIIHVTLPLYLNMNILNIFIFLLIKISIFWSNYLNMNSFLEAISFNQADEYFETLMKALFFYNIMPFVLKNYLSIVKPIKAVLTVFMDYAFKNYKNQKNETKLFKIKVKFLLSL